MTAPPATGRTRVGAYVVVRDPEGRILLCRIGPDDPAAGYWTLPGGGIEWGADPAEAAIRELREETGLNGFVDGVAGVYSRTFGADRRADGQPVHSLGIVYHAVIIGGTLRDEVGGSSDRCAWVATDDVDPRRLVTLAQWALRLPDPVR